MNRSLGIKTFFTVLILSVLMLCGCSESSSADTTTFQLNKDGTVTHTIVGSTDAEEQELRSYTEDLISAYNTDEEDPAVKLDSLSVDTGTSTVKIVMTYASASDYALFNQVNAFSGTLAEAAKAGYGFEGQFSLSSGESISGYTLPVEYPQLYVLILQEPLNVVLDGATVLCTGTAVLNEDGSYTISSNTDTSLPDVFQTVNSSYSYFIYKTDK